MELFKNPNVNFVAVRRRAMLFSAIVIVAGLASFAIHRGFKMSIDFAGGALVEIGLATPVPVADIRAVVSAAGFEGAEITRFGEAGDYLIKVKSVGDAAGVAERLKTAVSAGVGGQSVDLRRVESVGPKIGSELRTAAFWAVMYSLLGILIYVSFRFDFRFAVASIIATGHDVLITLAFLSFVGMEISLTVIAAILTVVGYSLNDTVVVFDRIRENLGIRRREDLGTLINTSINETLSRTVITGGTTLLSLAALIILGGEVIRDFALTLMVGIIIGTFSSIFIASPVLIEWQLWRPRKSK
ncbi:MAG TPA: protein translocase subunit SecF [Candidatus Krumholzibacteria bacterium]|nr:protein translocase subunit SecF [Candidatus Krumholzibacteria bacterium]